MGPGTGTFYQVTRFKDADAVLRDDKTFSSSINAEHIGQFMGDLILAMNGDEHRKYRNLVAKAFRASQLERWDDTLVRPDHQPPARRDRAARPRRPRRVGHVEVSGAGHLRDRGRAARGLRAVRAVGRGDQHRSDGARARARGERGDGRVPASARRGAARGADRRLPLRPRARRGRRRAAQRRQDLRLPAPAVAGGRRDDVPRHGQRAARAAHASRRPRAGLRRSRSHPRGHRGDAALGDVGDDGEPRRDRRHRGRRLPDRGGLAGRRAHRFGEPRRGALGRCRRVEARPAGAAPPRVRHRPAPVPRHAPRAAGAAGRAQRDPRPAARTCASIPTAPTTAIIEGYAFRGPRALPVTFDPS